MLNHLGQLALDFILKFPLRAWRLFLYSSNGVKSILGFNIRIRLVPWWWFGLVLMLADWLGLVELYEGLSAMSKFRSRPLDAEESKRAKLIFGDTIDLQRVRIDERAWLGPKQYQFCYVSFHTINSWGLMRDDILIHELVHVWQYERFGAIYIAKALQAQAGEGYDYGGWARLNIVKRTRGKLLDFNFEQQADIVMDYYRLLTGRTARWGNATAGNILEYEYFVDQLKE